MLVVLFLLINYQSVPVLKSVFCPTVEIFDDFRPFLGPFVLFDALQELNVFLRFPRSFLEVRVQIAVPMLSTLLCISKDFIFSIIEKV